MDKSNARRLKVHLVLGGALTLALLVNVIWKMASGERLLQALWNSFREIRPFEWLMIFVLWYSAAFPRPQDEWLSSSITKLGLLPRQ